MTTNHNAKRYGQLLAWMSELDISFTAVGEQLGVSNTYVRRFCQNDTCPTRHHSKLIELGFPAELLPAPVDKPKGPQRKIPRFPGLAQGVQKNFS